MATDVGLIIRSLTDFYDFGGAEVIEVGAGGGQLVDFARKARRVLAIDIDRGALDRLAERLEVTDLADRFELRHADLLDVRDRADVVLFEFCLHEMASPRIALEHATQLAADVLIIDHGPGSEWAWVAHEDDKAKAAWQAVSERSPRRTVDCETSQVFADHEELVERVRVQGETAVQRAGAYREQRPVVILMRYRMALI